MKIMLLAAALIAASPVVAVPTPADAQVLAGRNAARNASRPARVTAEERRENRLRDAEDRVFELDEKIAELNTASESPSGLTPAQQRQLAQLTARREDAQRTVDRLTAEM